MDILHKARMLESRISRVVSRATASAVGSGALEPLEIVHAIVDHAERQIQPGGRGARVFPFNRVAVSVLAASRDARARLDAVLSGPPSVRARLLERVQSAGCDLRDLDVHVAYVGRAAQNWVHPQFHVGFERVVRPAAPVPVDDTLARLEIIVVRGAAGRRTYAFGLERIELGRGVEVRDSRNRLLRTNQIAFVDGAADENQTVSRRHAHIAHDSQRNEYRLYDDGSVHGTGIIRGGRTVPVPPGSRGVRVQSGDEIVLGEARIRIRIEGGSTSHLDRESSA